MKWSLVLPLILAVVIIGLVGTYSLPVLHSAQARSPASVSILAVNDFHGHLFPGQELNGKPAGSAPVLASYLKAAMDTPGDDLTILALTGDTIGASPRETALLMDEPSVLFFNSFANAGCTKGDSPCNVISVPGNHEFNRGVGELLRMVHGGNSAAEIPRLADPYPGAMADTICANVVWKENQTPILPPYTLRYARGIPIAFIGIVTLETPILELPMNIETVEFLDEAETINRYVATLQKDGVHASVILFHEGADQEEAYEGATRPGGNVTGPAANITSALDPDVDVILAAHWHRFTNAYIPNSGGNDVLVVQAYAYGMAYAYVDLRLDPESGDIIEKSAVIVPVYADQPPGTDPDPGMKEFLDDVEEAVGRLGEEVIAVTASDITRAPNPAGDSALGSLVADSQREAMGTDVAFATIGSLPGAIQADIATGEITWDDLEAVLPADPSMAATYGGWYSRPRVASRNVTSEQVRQVLERQWEDPVPEERLSVSGLSYTWDPSRPAGERVTEIRVDGVPLEPGATYSAAMNYYMAYGGHGGGGNYSPAWDWDVTVTIGPADIDALIAYIRSLPAPLEVAADGRIVRAG